MKNMYLRSLFLAIITLILVNVSAFAQESSEKPKDVEAIKIPEYWDHFTIMIWQLGHNAKDKKAQYEKVNLNAFHIDRSDKNLAAFSKENKWPFYVDHTASKGYLHLGDKHFKTLDMKTGALQVRPNSLTDPVTIKTMKDLIKGNVEAAKDAYPLAYALDDEVSTGSFSTPIEVDTHPTSILKYRAFLKNLYGNDIAKLNAQYGSKFATFDEINPKTFNDYRKEVGPKTLDKLNLSHWADWRSYMDDYFADCLKDLTHYANSLDPRPCGFVGGQGPTAFGGWDWRKLSKSAQWVEAYESGGNNEVIRSFWGQKRPLLKTFFPGKTFSEKNIWFLWYYMCHGNRGVIVWPDGMFDKEGNTSEGYLKMAPTFKEIQGDVSKLIMDSDFQYDKVAIYYSQPSIQVTWCLDSASHGGTWPNRKSSMDNNISTSHLTRMGWSKALEDIGIQAKYFHMDHLLAGEIEKQGFKVLILNRSLALSDAEVAKIKEFAKNGGTVIADHLPATFDEHGKSRSTGALDDLFGIKRDASKGILDNTVATEVDGERGGSLSDKNWIGKGAPQFKNVAVFELGIKATTGKAKETVSDTDVVIKNTFGKGIGIYLNLSTIGYYLNRSKAEPKEFLIFLKSTLKELGIEPKIDLLENGKEPYLLETINWKKDKKNILCVFRNISQGSSITGDEKVEGNIGTQNLKVTIKLKEAVKGFKDERTGKVYGDGKEFIVEFLPFEAGVFSFE
jgi:hypothetical protein